MYVNNDSTFTYTVKIDNQPWVPIQLGARERNNLCMSPVLNPHSNTERQAASHQDNSNPPLNGF